MASLTGEIIRKALNARVNAFIRWLRWTSRDPRFPLYAGLVLTLYLAYRFFAPLAIYIGRNPQTACIGVILGWVLVSIFLRFIWRWKDTFRDNFKHGIRPNIWEYYGDWKVEPDEKGNSVLDVTNSATGGIAVPTIGWKDYEFEFDARIMHEWIGWIVRASSLNMYVHQKLGAEKLHTHYVMPGLFEPLAKDKHDQKLVEKEWYTIGVSARGPWLTVHIYADGEEITIYREKVLGIQQARAFEVPVKDKPKKSISSIVVPSYASGALGFRLHGPENAQYRNIRAYQFK